LSELIRFGVSIDQDLLENYDRLIGERGYATRSEALRDLIRDALIQQKIETQTDVEALGSLTLVYDHHAQSGARNGKFSASVSRDYSFGDASARQPRRLSGNHRSARRRFRHYQSGKRSFEFERHQKRKVIFDFVIFFNHRHEII
jgi:Arc/MetJ-type ribon-helix-helix transcriptional regulator